MKTSHNSELLILILATIFISTSGALGKYIAMPTPIIIWWRSALAMVFLFAYCQLKGISLKIKSRKEIGPFVISALFLGAHWITYFYSLKMSNVAIGMLSLFTFPIITAFLEPLFYKSRLDPVHIILGIMVLVGIYILAPEFDLNNNYTLGILLGILSAACYALRILILKKHTEKNNGTMLMFHQVLVLSIVLLPALLFMDGSGIKTQYPYVLLLALLTTAIGHTLFIRSLKYFKASTASIIGSTQPVFGILIAFFFLNEIPHANTVVGGLIILTTVIIESWRSKRST